VQENLALKRQVLEIATAERFAGAKRTNFKRSDYQQLQQIVRVLAEDV
jgi:hypothetical protein